MFPASVPLFYLLQSSEKGVTLLPPCGSLVEMLLKSDFCLQTLLTGANRGLVDSAMFILD